MVPAFRQKYSMQAPSTAENSQKCTPHPTPGERQPENSAHPLFLARGFPTEPRGKTKTKLLMEFPPSALRRTKESPPHVVRSGGSFMSEDAPERQVALGPDS